MQRILTSWRLWGPRKGTTSGWYQQKFSGCLICNPTPSDIKMTVSFHTLGINKDQVENPSFHSQQASSKLAVPSPVTEGLLKLYF